MTRKTGSRRRGPVTPRMIILFGEGEYKVGQEVEQTDS